MVKSFNKHTDRLNDYRNSQRRLFNIKIYYLELVIKQKQFCGSSSTKSTGSTVYTAKLLVYHVLR